jgi:RNA-directed DNA polymerase
VQGFIKAKYRYAVDIDLSKFFDQVDHDLLMYRLGQRINDKRVLSLIGRYLRAGISDKGQVNPSLRGVPQGGPLSPLLANIMLDDLDRYLESKHYRFARYADDFVISVKTFEEGQRIKQEVETFLTTLKLPINQEKSKVVPVRELCFLGYQFKGRHLQNRYSRPPWRSSNGGNREHASRNSLNWVCQSKQRSVLDLVQRAITVWLKPKWYKSD